MDLPLPINWQLWPSKMLLLTVVPGQDAPYYSLNQRCTSLHLCFVGVSLGTAGLCVHMGMVSGRGREVILQVSLLLSLLSWSVTVKSKILLEAFFFVF